MADEKQYILNFLASIHGDKQVVSSLKRMERVIGQQGKAMGIAGTGAKNFGQIIGGIAQRALLTVPVWLALRTAMMSFLSLIRNSITFLIDWEFQMAQIRIVAKGTKEEYEKLSVSLLKIASKYGSSFKEIGKASKLWAQQGRTTIEIMSLMDTTMKFAMLTGRSMEETVEDLTSIMKNYNIEASNTVRIVDSVTEIMLHHAITSETLVGAMKQVAPVASQFNISFEKMLGIITATHIATRAKGQRMGKAWVTILSRMATSSRNTIQKLSGVAMFLDRLGKATFEETGTLRNLGDVLDEIALKFDTFNSKTQAMLGYSMAGRRRLELLVASMSNYEEAIIAEIEALTSWGSSEKATQILLETTKTKIGKVGATWNTLLDNFANTGAIKGGLNLLLGGLTNISKLIAIINGSFTEMLATEDYTKQKEAMTTRYNIEIAKANAVVKLHEQLIKLQQLRENISKKGTIDRTTDDQLENRLKLLTQGLSKAGIPEDILTGDLEAIVSNLKDYMKDAGDIVKKSEIAKEFHLKLIDMKMDLVNLVTAGKDINKAFKSMAGIGLKSFTQETERSTKAWEEFISDKVQFADLKILEQLVTLRKDYLKVLEDHKNKQQEISSFRRSENKFLQNQLSLLEDIKRNSIERAGITIVEEEEWRKKLKLIAKEKDLGKSALDIVDQKLQYLQDIEDSAIGGIDKEIKKLRDEQRWLGKIREDYKEKNDTIEATGKLLLAQGYTQLQVEIQRLALLDREKDGYDAIYDQKRKIADLTIQSIANERQNLISLYLEYEKGNRKQRKRTRRKMELLTMSPEAVSSEFQKGGSDRKLILDLFTNLGKDVQQSLTRTMVAMRRHPTEGIASNAVDQQINTRWIEEMKRWRDERQYEGPRPTKLSKEEFLSQPPVVPKLTNNVDMQVNINVTKSTLKELTEEAYQKIMEEVKTDEGFAKAFAKLLRPYM